MKVSAKKLVVPTSNRADIVSEISHLLACTEQLLPRSVRGWVPYLVSSSLVAASTLVGMSMTCIIDEENFAMLYLLAVVAMASIYGRSVGIYTCLVSAFTYHFFVAAPRFSFVKCDYSCVFTFFVMMIVALIMEQLTERIRRQSRELEDRVRERTSELAEANDQLRSEITQRVQTQNALNHAIEQLAHSNASLAQFARVASHDLQEPLRALQGFTDLFARRYRGQFDEKADEFITHIQDCGNRMDRLIQGILSQARASAEDDIFEPVDLQVVLKEAITNLSVAIEETGAVIESEKLPVVLGDELQLTQVFQNLIGNALKFKGEKTPLIRISCRRENESWLIGVQDNGIGFEPRHEDEIFGMFKRLHGSTKYRGSGIGLAICKTVIEKLGGKIWVKTEPDKGSHFFIALPVCEAGTTPAAVDLIEAPGPFSADA